jgi:DNA (cytosine-5)-methyltransferase 1
MALTAENIVALTRSCTPSVQLTFIDLFAGLGGFHLALNSLNAKCVLACEKDVGLRTLYETNFDVTPLPDIRELVAKDVPDHDVLCAGFPCQSFSKAGAQLGMSCLQNGDLINCVLDILIEKLPRFLLLENVPNLERHDNGATWGKIKELLEEHYEIDHRKYSPHHFGIPQIRERMFIVGARKDSGGLKEFQWPPTSNEKPCIRKILDENPLDARPLSPVLAECIAVWQEFLDLFPNDKQLPSFPIWSMEFGATYPCEGLPPSKRQIEELQTYKGSFGCPLTGMSLEQIIAALPSHARGNDPFPEWKTQFIRQNRELHEANKDWIDVWLPKIGKYVSSFQKFEWNCKGETRKLSNHVLQIRASGVRVKRDTTAPSLIAMTSTQVPIIGWEQRYMTPTECARLQSMEGIQLPSSPTPAYRALGNAVNVSIVTRIAEALILPKPPQHVGQKVL